MPPIFLDALPFLPLALAPAVFVLLGPFVSARTRTVFGALLLLVAAGFAADIAFVDHSETYSLAVPNVFLSADTGQPKEWTVAHESAPAWAWHVCVIVWFGTFGGWLLLRRHTAWATRSPVPGATILFLVYLVVRLALEKCAAHRGVVWASRARRLLRGSLGARAPGHGLLPAPAAHRVRLLRDHTPARHPPRHASRR